MKLKQSKLLEFGKHTRYFSLLSLIFNLIIKIMDFKVIVMGFCILWAFVVFQLVKIEVEMAS